MRVAGFRKLELRSAGDVSGLKRKSAGIRVGLAAFALGIAVTPIISGQVNTEQGKRETAQMTFDVASVHEWGRAEGPAGPFTAGVQFSTGRVRSQCASLQALVFYGYQLTGSERLDGLPKWGNASCGYPDSAGAFAIEATMPATTTGAESRQMIANSAGRAIQVCCPLGNQTIADVRTENCLWQVQTQAVRSRQGPANFAGFHRLSIR